MGYRVKDTMGGIHGMRCKGCDIEDKFRERGSGGGLHVVGCTRRDTTGRILGVEFRKRATGMGYGKSGSRRVSEKEKSIILIVICT